MVLRRQTGTEEKLGSPSLRHHALPSPLHPYSSAALAHIFLFPFQSHYSCPSLPLWFPSPHLIFSSHPVLSSSPSPYPSFLSLPADCCLSKQVLQCVVPPKDRAPPPHTPPPQYPMGGDRALPSDYTGGAGLEYSPEGQQLSISDNCRERDTRVCTNTYTHPHLFTPSLIRGPSPSNGPE